MLGRLDGDGGGLVERVELLLDALPPLGARPQPVRGDDLDALELAGLVDLGRADQAGYQVGLEKEMSFFFCLA